MKTKLEVGKEYWLGEAKKYKGIYKGNFGDAHYFEPTTWIPTYRDEQAHVPFIKDANGFVEFPLRGVFEVESWQFTTPIAMKCTEEQFNEIGDNLFEMGYELSTSCDLIDGIWLVNNFGGVSNCFGLACGTPFQKTKFNSFNPDLFLALAAMTDKEDGINGEWWKCVDIDDTAFGSLYIKTKENFSEMFRLDEKDLVETGFDCASSSEFRKATAQEIIEHFEKKEFVLPKFWHVVVTEENVDVLSKWRFGEEYPKHKLNIGYIVGFSSWQNSKQHNPSDSRGSFGSEITFDQFKKYVLKGTTQSCPIIHIPPTKQATLFDDRVEITDWKPKEGEKIWVVLGTLSPDQFYYRERICEKEDIAGFPRGGFIKRTESEAKQLVEKLKQAML